jgi:hypothetical protein
MPKKPFKDENYHWDLIRVLIVAAGIIGIILSILNLRLWNPLYGLAIPYWVIMVMEICICGTLIVGFGILGWDIWEDRKTFFAILIIGLVFIFLFWNYVGIMLVVVAIPIPFGS